jgi:hypothetical protein
MISVLWLTASALADAGLGCGCNRATPPDYVPCRELEEGDTCINEVGAPGVCEDDDCNTESAEASSRAAAGAMSVAGGTLVLIRRRRR